MDLRFLTPAAIGAAIGFVGSLTWCIVRCFRPTRDADTQHQRHASQRSFLLATNVPAGNFVLGMTVAGALAGAGWGLWRL